MGQRETPAHARAVLLPPRPAAHSCAADLQRDELPQDEPPSSERTQRRSKERDSCVEVFPADAFPAGALKAEESAAPAERKRSPSVPPLPVAALERPSPSRSDRTPSPVPRVSLVPPTGRIDPSQLAELNALDGRGLPTIAPRLRASSIPPATVLPVPAMTRPHLLYASPAPKSRKRLKALAQRLATDVRSSKREIALGLVIGIVLSFLLGKVGQSYLESRGRADPLEVQSFANEPAPAAQRGSDPALRNDPVPQSGAPVLQSGDPALQSDAPSYRPSARPRATLPRATLPRATLPRATLPRAKPARERDSSPPAEPSERSPSVPLSPSESAGLGLELPL